MSFTDSKTLVSQNRKMSESITSVEQKHISLCLMLASTLIFNAMYIYIVNIYKTYETRMSDYYLKNTKRYHLYHEVYISFQMFFNNILKPMECFSRNG